MNGNKKKKDPIEDQTEDSFESAEEACQACGGELVVDKVNLEEFENGKLYLMENVIAHVCQQCGEVWVPEPVIKEFEKMMHTAKTYASKHHAKPKLPGNAGKKKS